MMIYIGNKLQNIEDIKQEDVRVDEIARSLSRQNRFLGHTRYPYSVAQHAVLTSYLCPEDLAYECLHHDDTEAYVGDLLGPLKRRMPEYREIEHAVRAALCQPLRLAASAPAIKQYDTLALVLEQCLVQGRADIVFPYPPYGSITTFRELEHLVRQLHPKAAEKAYMDRHYATLPGPQ